MRLRDNPIIEVSRELTCSPQQAWDLVTDITLPTTVDGELQSVEWLDGADAVVPGARFRGHNRNDDLGDWFTDSIVVEVEDGRRWVWSVEQNGDSAWATWGFEVDPTGRGARVRQWVRIGDGASPFAAFIGTQPKREARIIDHRLSVLRAGIEANLDEIERRAR